MSIKRSGTPIFEIVRTAEKLGFKRDEPICCKFCKLEIKDKLAFESIEEFREFADNGGMCKECLERNARRCLE